MDSPSQPTLNNALYVFSKSGDLEGVRQALESGADLHHLDPLDGWPPLHAAAHYEQPAVIDLLIDAGACVDFVPPFIKGRRYSAWAGRPALMVATGLEAASRLLAAGADPDIQDASHDTALHLAAKFDSWPLVRMLLDHGASQTVSDKQGRTAFEVAQKLHHKNLIENWSAYNAAQTAQLAIESHSASGLRPL